MNGMMHNDFYRKVMDDAGHRIIALFSGGPTSVHDLIGHDEINTEKDLHCLVTYVEKHGNCCERVSAMISAAEWMQAYNELHENI